MTIRLAENGDLEDILKLDQEAIDANRHNSFLTRSVEHQSCWMIFDEEFAGYGIIEHSFFERAFIEMLYIRKSKRRLGLGLKLFCYLESQARTEKVFTSTNLSNTNMHGLLKKAGYQMCGTVFELDEEDPELFYFKLLKT